MDLQVLDYLFKPTKTRLGLVSVRYGDLLLRCELVYHVEEKKIWIRMPEFWINREKKVRYATWSDKKTSDDFQETVKKILLERYGIDRRKAAHLHAEACLLREQAKSDRQDLKEDLP